MNAPKALVINSTLIAVSTSTLSIILHEGAHFLTALCLNVPAVMHHNYLRTPDSTPLPLETVIAAAGPLFSLVLGVVVLTISIYFIRVSLLKLFTLWLGMQNIVVFLGYLLLAPITTTGDTGRVFAYLGIPVYLSIGIAIGAFIYIRYLYGRLARQFVYYTASPDAERHTNQQQLLVFPVIGSIVFGVLLNLPITYWVSLLPAIFMPMTYISTWQAYKKLSLVEPTLVINKVSIPLMLLTVSTIGLFRYLV